MSLKQETSVLVVGAGPVGLFAALSLAERGVDVTIIDREWRGTTHSYALALHPRTLALLEEHDVASTLLEQGHRIDRIAYYDGDQRVTVLDLAALGAAFPFLLVVPQSTVERVIEERLRRARVNVLWNHQAKSVREDADAVQVRVARMEKYSMGYPIARTEWMVAQESDVRAAFVVGADGYHSFVREACGARFEQHGSAETFAVFEFSARLDFPREARVIFHEGTTNVVWPLDDSRARFSFQVPHDDPPAPNVESLQRLVRERAPWFRHEVERIDWATAALFERRLVDRFGRGRVWLAGDAAHITGPVGAQSMNVGIREADDLATRISASLKQAGSADGLAGYDAERIAEWRCLLGIDARLESQATSASWARGPASQVLPCVPASGGDLAALLLQAGLSLN